MIYYYLIEITMIYISLVSAIGIIVYFLIPKTQNFRFLGKRLYSITTDVLVFLYILYVLSIIYIEYFIK